MAGKPRKPKIQQPRAGTNGFDPDVLNAIVGRVENVLAEKESAHGVYMAKCKVFNEDIADILDEAKARGIPKKPLKKTLEERRLKRQIEALREGLDLVDQESFDQIRIKLGMLADLPLGEAALKGKAPPDGEPDVRPPFLKDKEAEASAANAEALAGMKTLKQKGPKLGGADADGSYKMTN